MILTKISKGHFINFDRITRVVVSRYPRQVTVYTDSDRSGHYLHSNEEIDAFCAAAGIEPPPADTPVTDHA